VQVYSNIQKTVVVDFRLALALAYQLLPKRAPDGCVLLKIPSGSLLLNGTNLAALRDLCLSHAYLDNEAAEKLAALLKSYRASLTKLASLDVSFNEMTADGVVALGDEVALWHTTGHETALWQTTLSTNPPTSAFVFKCEGNRVTESEAPAVNLLFSIVQPQRRRLAITIYPLLQTSKVGRAVRSKVARTGGSKSKSKSKVVAAAAAAAETGAETGGSKQTGASLVASGSKSTSKPLATSRPLAREHTHTRTRAHKNTLEQTQLDTRTLPSNAQASNADAASLLGDDPPSDGGLCSAPAPCRAAHKPLSCVRVHGDVCFWTDRVCGGGKGEWENSWGFCSRTVREC
jgi:hypothetical protein